MFLAHSFRLRDPWQCDCTLEGPTGGAVRWSRVFHRPTGLEDDDALWLVCSGLPSGVQVTLNAQRLTAPTHAGPYQFEVTSAMADTNRIELLVPSAPSPVHRLPSPGAAFPYDVRLGVIGHS